MSIALDSSQLIARVWARKGQRPIVRVQHLYQWLYVYGFACPESGATSVLLLPTVSIEVFAIALTHFAQVIGAGPDRHIILVLDRAGWHSSPTLVIPNGIHLVFLPPYSPELQRGSAPLATLGPRLSPIVALRRWMNCKKCKQSGALLFKTIRPVSVTLLSSTGGLPRFPKSNVVISESASGAQSNEKQRYVSVFMRGNMNRQ